MGDGERLNRKGDIEMDAKIQVEVIWERDEEDPPEYDKKHRRWGTLFIRPLLKQDWGWLHLKSTLAHGYMEVNYFTNRIKIFDQDGWSTALIDCDEIITKGDYE